VCCSGDSCVGDGDNGFRRTAAGFVLVVDDLFEAAVLEEHVLAGVQLVA
jgi:hypothetical protein